MDFSHRVCPFSFPMKGVKEKEYRPRKKDDILIIQSSSIGTSASRRYQSVQSSLSDYQEWDNATGTSFQETCSEINRVNEYSYSQNGSACLPEEEKRSHAECNNAQDDGNTANTDESSPIQSELEALMHRMGSYNKASSIPTIQERFEMLQDVKQKCLDYLLRILFGDNEKCIKKPNQIDRTTTPGEASANNPVTMLANDLAQNLGTGWSHYSFYHYEESETTYFDTTGTAITADGRELSFNINLEMSRSFVQMAEEKIDFGQPRLCDPLVINLGCNVASVSDQKFFFDIDADGIEDEISMLGKNSGYLALDTNTDGSINDGSELFGTESGNGFHDLLPYDEDGNGWIDEADSIFQKLKIWSMDENGISTLIDLKEAGVGAIYLGYEDTEFSLKNVVNETNAVIQKTGLFLYENGYSGTVQQMDLAV